MQECDIRLLMLVDADPAQSRLVATIASRAGWRTLCAHDAASAAAVLESQDALKLDAAVLDQSALGSDLAPFIMALKSRHPTLPMLLMTAKWSNEVTIEALRAGAADFISTPVVPDQLIAALSMAADSAKMMPPWANASSPSSRRLFSKYLAMWLANALGGS